MDDAAIKRRRLRREFIWSHHPDHGGDSASFATGLMQFSERLPARPSKVTVVAVPSRSWQTKVTSCALRLVKKPAKVSRVR